MLKSLKIMEWNLNFKSDKEVNVAGFIKNKVENEDIIIFTEIVKSDSVLRLMRELNDFNFYESYNTEGNQIIIAIRRNIKVTRVITKIPKISTHSAPNFLHIEVLINGVKYQILGIRIRIDDGSEEDYKDRRKQFEYFSNYISDLDNVIILGDFNNSYIRGDLKASYSKTKKLYEKNSKGQLLTTRFFNYHMMKDIIGEDINIFTPSNKKSWGLKKINDSFDYGYIQNDHLMVSKGIFIEEYDYDWDFVCENKEKYQAMNADKTGSIDVEKGYPDHAVLWAEIKLQIK
jgi:hypothetical protein